MPRVDNEALKGLADTFLGGSGPFDMGQAMSILGLLATAGIGSPAGAATAAEADDAAPHAAGPRSDPGASGNAPLERSGTRLRLVEARYRALVEQIPAVVFLASLEGGVSEIYVSPQIETLLGFTQKEWTSNPVLWFRQLHPDDRTQLSREFAQACLTGKAWRGMIRVFSRDQKLVYVHAEARLVRDDAGRPLFLQGVAFDITEQQRSQETQQHLLLEQAARAAAEAAVHRAAVLARVSQALSSSFDYQRALGEALNLLVPEMADFGAVELVQPDRSLSAVAFVHRDRTTSERMRGLLARHSTGLETPGAGKVARTGQPELCFELEEEDATDGPCHPPPPAMQALHSKSYLLMPIKTRESVLGVLTLGMAESGRRYGQVDADFAADVAQRAALAIDNGRLYREAEEASRLKDEFLAVLSHELRTPLNAIVGWTHILRETMDDSNPGVKKAVETIARNAQVQNQLISDILDVSRIIAGKMVLSLKEVDTAAVVRAALDTVHHAAEAKQVRLLPMLDHSAGPVSGDPDRLQQVVWNLVANAIKFAPKKTGHVQVRLEAVNSHIEITVEDNGPGIDPTFLPYIFDRFRQQDSSSSRRHGGLGLGLAIVRHLVELHGGTVAASNAEGHTGAIFTVRLPRRSVSAERRKTERHPAADAPLWLENAPPLDGLRVLVVDDQPDALDMVATLLQRCGASAVTAASAEEARAALAAGRFDVLLADIEMPDEDGYSLIRSIRAMPPEEGGLVPAAALTAFASTQDRVKVLAAGFQMHVPKPVQPAELAAVVASLGGLHNPRQT